MSFWERIKEDLKEGMKEGAETLKAGFEVVKGKTGELTEQGIKKYKVYNLKNEVKDNMADLGARFYAMAKEDPKSVTDPQAVGIIEKISGLQEEIEALEKK